jgi:hypothetical protein
MTETVLTDYDVPDDLISLVDEGFLKISTVDEDERTIYFTIPSKQVDFTRDHIMIYPLVWIHPDFNDQFCHFYIAEPGDLPNFFVERQYSDAAPEAVDGLDSVDELISWLDELKESNIA